MTKIKIKVRRGIIWQVMFVQIADLVTSHGGTKRIIHGEKKLELELELKVEGQGFNDTSFESSIRLATVKRNEVALSRGQV